MNGIIIEVKGYEKTDTVATSEADFVGNLKQAYLKYFDKQFGTLPVGFPFLRIPFSIGKEKFDIVFDEELFEQLCKIYIVLGWKGIIDVEKVLPAQSSKERNFFLFTKNTIGMMVRDSLINIEKRSAERIILVGNEIRDKLAAEKARYGVQLQFEDNVVTTLIRYSLTNPNESKELFKLLTEAVAARDSLKLIEDQLSRKTSQARFTTKSPYPNSTVQQEVVDLANLKKQADEVFGKLEKLIADKHPLGLLIFGALKKGFNKPDMEHLFGQTVNALINDYEKLAKGIDPRRSRVAEHLPQPRYSDLMQNIDKFQIPEKGLADSITAKAVENFRDNSFQPILAEKNIEQIFKEGIMLSQDSFDYCVWRDYSECLYKQRQEILKTEKAEEEFWKRIGKISAGLSLALLIIPGSSIILIGAEAVVNIALLTHTVDSVTNQLQRNDDLMKDALTNQDGSTTDTLAQFGEILSINKEFAKTMTLEIAKEILFICAGNLATFKRFIDARNYYSDLETLTE